MPEYSDFNKKLLKAMGKKEETPRLSLNKLGEYMDADALKRRQIIKDAKKPKKFKMARYSEVRRAIGAYLSKGFDEEIILNVIERIESKEAETDWQADDYANSIAALEAVLAIDFSELEGYDISIFDKKDNELINIGGLDISVYPDVIIQNGDSGKIGTLKTHISKNAPLSQKSLDYISCILRYYFIALGTDEKLIDYNLCMSVDVFTGEIQSASKAYIRRISNIEAACKEIVAIWDLV